MPELPEVETTRRGIRNSVIDQTVQQVIVRETRLRWPIPTTLCRDLPGQTIHTLRRRGKYLLFQTDNGTLLLHLGMSGSLRITTPQTPIKKHDHVDLVFRKHTLRLNDPRRFGCLLWTTDDPEQHALLNTLGPEPLSRQFNGKVLFDCSRQRTITVKQFIMNHRVVVGVGNIYACEALFMAGISPLRGANKVNLAHYETLADTIKTVLKKAIKAGGTTLKDFYNANGKAGYFKQQLKVYGQDQQPCPQCQTTIRKVIIGQRSSFYCKRCQQ